MESIEYIRTKHEHLHRIYYKDPIKILYKLFRDFKSIRSLFNKNILDYLLIYFVSLWGMVIVN